MEQTEINSYQGNDEPARFFHAKEDCKDVRLVRSVQNGDNHAFSALFNKYYHVIVGYIVNNVPKSRVSAYYIDDIASEVFMKAYTLIFRLNIESFKGLLIKCAKYKISHFVRSSVNSFSDSLQAHEDEEYHHENIIDLITPEQEAIIEDFKHQISKLITCLPDIYIQPAELFFLYNYKQEEISKKLKVSKVAVNNRICYARNFIASKFKRTRYTSDQRKSKKFSDSEIKYIKKHYDTTELRTLYSRVNNNRDLKMSYDFFRLQCNRLGLKKTNKRNFFSDEEEQFLKDNYKKLSQVKLVESLNINRCKKINRMAVARKLKEMELT